MGWETRAGQRYFYKSVRIGGRPGRVYYGRGEAGEEQARLEAERRRQRQAAREALHAEQARVTVADTALREARGLADLLLQAVLLCTGFHCHRGCWRRRCAYATNGDERAHEAPGG